MESGDVVLLAQNDRVAIGPQRSDLLHVYNRWLNDIQIRAALGESLIPVTLETGRTIFDETSNAAAQVWFTLYDSHGKRPIGITGLRDIDDRNLTAEFVIFIGERDCWGKGIGTAATRLLLDYGFAALGMHNIMLKVFSFNEPAIRAYRRAGFKEIGRRRQGHRLAGSVYDVIYMDCLSSEFEGSLAETLIIR